MKNAKAVALMLAVVLCLLGVPKQGAIPLAPQTAPPLSLEENSSSSAPLEEFVLGEKNTLSAPSQESSSLPSSKPATPAPLLEGEETVPLYGVSVPSEEPEAIPGGVGYDEIGLAGVQTLWQQAVLFACIPSSLEAGVHQIWVQLKHNLSFTGQSWLVGESLDRAVPLLYLQNGLWRGVETLNNHLVYGGASVPLEVEVNGQNRITRAGLLTPPMERAVQPPSYVINGARALAQELISLQKEGRTFTLAALSDMHYESWGYMGGDATYPDGVHHAVQALEEIGKAAPLDAIGVLGDYTDGLAQTQLSTALYDFEGVNGWLATLTVAPVFRLQGNHDFVEENSPVTHRYIASQNPDTVVWGSQRGGYFYQDFEGQKVRMICLNTSELGNMSVHCSLQQYRWFIQSLNLSAKENAEDWQVLILSHIPLDMWAYEGKYRFAYILDAYQKGISWTDGEISCDFSGGKNAARLVGNIHGHIHNLVTEKLFLGNVNEQGTPQSEVWRLSTPNACFGSENKGYAGYTQDMTYSKLQNSVTDTAFTVYCVNLDTFTVTALNYGAGETRVVRYG